MKRIALAVCVIVPFIMCGPKEKATPTPEPTATALPVVVEPTMPPPPTPATEAECIEGARSETAVGTGDLKNPHATCLECVDGRWKRRPCR